MLVYVEDQIQLISDGAACYTFQSFPNLWHSYKIQKLEGNLVLWETCVIEYLF